jgi:hypothetical protein
VTTGGRAAPRGSRAARRAHQRRRFLTVAVLCAAVAAGGIAALLATHTSSATSPSSNAHVQTSAQRQAPTTTTLDPGALPQTTVRPPTRGSALDNGVAGLWRAVVTDDPSPAIPFFFPLSAYLQVKAIRDPASDWQHRLVGAYQQDIHALHLRLGAAASNARVDGMDIPATATWVPIGAEYNKLSYGRVYDARVRFTANGRSDSFTIASMISWRGRWYIVHLARIA